MSAIQFVGTEVIYRASADIANVLSVSLVEDTYTFDDTSDKITDVIGKPDGCEVSGISGAPEISPVTIRCDTNLIDRLTFDLGNGNDSVILHSARDTVQFLGQDDDDSLLISQPNQVTAPVLFDGGGGQNSLTLDASSDTVSNTLTVGSDSIGAGPADSFFAPGGGLASYAGLQHLAIHLGTGGDTVIVESMNIPSMLIADGGGSDLLAIDDSGETESHDYGISSVAVVRDSALVVAYEGVESLEVVTGSNSDRVVVDAFGPGLPAAIRVSTGRGNDSFEVKLGAPSAAASLVLDGGDDVDDLVVTSGNSSGAIMIDDQDRIVAGAAVISPMNVEGLTLSGSEDADVIDISKSTRGITVFAGGGNDEVIGGSGDDIIFGGAGSDMINAGEGNDAINTGDGNDIIFGGGGNDLVNGGSGDDQINTGDGNDIIFGGSGNDLVNGGSGNDQINTGDGNDVIFGGSGNDLVNGGAGDDQVNTGDGNDIIFGGGGNDLINGGSGDDEINTGDGNDIIFGGSGYDLVNSGSGNDQINTGDGNDVIFGGSGNDMINTGDGNDIVFGGDEVDIISGGDGDDVLVGGAGDDILDGGAGDDIYFFGDGNLGFDQILEQPFADTDTLNFSGMDSPVTVDLSSLSVQMVSPDRLDLQFNHPMTPGAVEFSGLENVVGTAYADTVFGNSRDNRLLGADVFDFPPAQKPDGVARTQWVLLDFDSHTDAGEWIYSDTERSAIQSRLEADFADFSFQFTQQPAEIPSASFATLYFNKLGSLNQPGQADELDFRNLNLGGTAAIDVNVLLGEPDLNSANVIAASAAIGAHELGHLVGLRHADSFGPVGFGIHSPPGGDGFRPVYAGPTNAFETAQHLMASPNSVGSTVADVLGDPFFSERSAVKLAFAQSGQVIQESLVGHAAPATAQPFDLTDLYVPNPLRAGLNRSKQFAVQAVDVLGTIELSVAGAVSESDVYAFTGRAGDVFTLEVMSAALDRISAPIDPVLRILDSAGNVLEFFDGLAENDDSFEPPDSLLVDFTIPSDGTYFAEIDTFTFVGHPDFVFFCGPGGEFQGSDACSDTDTGEYEFFLYRFDTGNPDDLGDLLHGGDGQDTLRGGPGDDTLAGGSGDNVMQGDLGDDTMILGAGRVDRVIELYGDNGGTDLLDFSGAPFGISIDLSIDDGSLQVVDLAGNQVAIEGVVEDLIGSLFADSLTGNARANVIDGLAGNDFLFGAAGDDVLTGNTGVDSIEGGSGIDTVREVRNADFTLSDSALTIGREGTDSLSSIEAAHLTGGADRNTMNASSFTGAATLLGLEGDDSLSGGIGDDFLDGGDGNDQITGGRGADILLGAAGNDHLAAGAGRDLLIGGMGIDRLVGAAGDDILVGGPTVYDGVARALREIVNRWNMNDAYGIRVQALRNGIAAPPDLPFSDLRFDATTVFDDGDIDDLTGSADRDWFLLLVGVDVTDRKPNESID